MVGAVPFFILALKWYFSRHARHARTGLGRVLNWWIGRFNERRGRPVFIFDVSKQVAAQVVLHFFNIIFTESSMLTMEARKKTSPCELYWFSTVADTTFGTFLMALLLKAVVRPSWFKHNFGSDFGNYRGEGHKMSYRIYFKQLAVWLGLVCIMRFILFMLTIIAWSCSIMDLSYLLFVKLITKTFIFHDSPNAEMFMVKTITPLIFNTFQIIWFDELIKGPVNQQASMCMLDSFGINQPLLAKQFFRTKAQIKNLSSQFNTFSEGELDAIWILEKDVLGAGEEDASEELTEEQKEAILNHISYLVEIFRMLDRTEGNSVTASSFKKVCKEHNNIANLFEVPDLTNMAARKRDQILVNHFRKKISKKKGPATFEDIVKFFHGRTKDVLDGILSFDNAQGGETNDAPDGPEPEITEEDLWRELPKWGDDRLPEELYDREVAEYHCKNKLQLQAARVTRNAELLPQQDCVGPAVPCVFLGVANNFAAFAFMPIIALGTMDCKSEHLPHAGGFADHKTIWGFVVDFIFLGVFVYNAIQLQEQIVKHTLIGQLATLEDFKFGDVKLTDNLSCKHWYRLMQFITFLNLLNVWTNAEVLGRVMATFQYCGPAQEAISHLWTATIKGSLMQNTQNFNILVLSTLMYLPIFLQPVWALLFAATPDTEVGYRVGHEPDQKHDNYWTMWQQRSGSQADHYSVVQVVSALISYEAVTFADYDRNRFLMRQCCEVADSEYEEVKRFGQTIKESLEEDATPSGSFASVVDIRDTYMKHSKACERLAQAVNDYYKAVQQEIQKSLVSRLLLVGLLQNALQTKVQITMFGLNYSLTKDIDYLFFIGVVGNLMSYLLSIGEFFEFFSLLHNYFEESHIRIAGMLQNEHVTLKYKQYDIRRLRQKRINIAYIFGAVFILIYMVLWVYLLVNFIMIFVCKQHMWNFNVNFPKGCLKEWEDENVTATTASSTPPWLLL